MRPGVSSWTQTTSAVSVAHASVVPLLEGRADVSVTCLRDDPANFVAASDISEYAFEAALADLRGAREGEGGVGAPSS